MTETGIYKGTTLTKSSKWWRNAKIGIVSTAAIIFIAWITPEPDSRTQEEKVETANAEWRAEQTAIALTGAKWVAIEACRDSILNSATYPSKTDFYAAVTALSDDSVNWSIIGTVDLMNDFGAMIPHQYACAVKGIQVISGSLQP